MGRIRVLVVDGHRIFAEALATALTAEPDVDVGAAGTAAAAERALERATDEHRPYDVVLIDADLGITPPLPPTALRRTHVGAESRPRPTLSLPQSRRIAAIPPQAPRTSAPTMPSGPPRPAVPAATANHQRAQPGRDLRPASRSDAAAGARAAVDGIALLARVCRTHPRLHAVVLAAVDDPQRAVRALQAGASGWVAKESSLAALMTVIRGVLRDETHLPPALLTGVVRELTSARRDRSESERLVAALTPREEEVLRCMVAGLGRQAVAERLYLSPHTVRTHMQNVLGKLGVHSTLAAVAVARRAGITPSEPPAPPPAATGSSVAPVNSSVVPVNSTAAPVNSTVASTTGRGAG
ncbi:response regulator transcription factor [Kitasatospora paracochleata]|uniref:DNA-binding NarL/FixJ family response regulator n=1 Tax=Kitasatospora paracochleata TaxID=58354 RepID=A0ABT1IQ57_9ACTN|nr:response regulator transcription factor [Kitasatospora paracochleata]MCP2307262.1 DNA-binding NarL/FixJ family response regulator [Kitasatospora paracochleata]